MRLDERGRALRSCRLYRTARGPWPGRPQSRRRSRTDRCRARRCSGTQPAGDAGHATNASEPCRSVPLRRVAGGLRLRRRGMPSAPIRLFRLAACPRALGGAGTRSFDKRCPPHVRTRLWTFRVRSGRRGRLLGEPLEGEQPEVAHRDPELKQHRLKLFERSLDLAAVLLRRTFPGLSSNKRIESCAVALL